MSQIGSFQVDVSKTSNHCPIGETVGHKNMTEGKIPVLSCEGACIRGEIARQAANLISKEFPYARACHGELFSVPQSAIARWVKQADRVVLIDGCFLRCHGRILEHLLREDQLIQFDALSYYQKYTNIFDCDDVPEEERLEVTKRVADMVLKQLSEDKSVTGAASCRLAKSDCCC